MADNGDKSSNQGKHVLSLYDLNPNDNPGNIITQVQLRGENYEEWARAMRTSLRARRKWTFIEGTVVRPKEGTTELEDWWTVQSMLISWILNTIEPSLRSTISYAENAKDLWNDIKERFSVANGPRIHQLKSELAGCKQGGMTIVAYYGKLKILWVELANYDQIPVCTCTGCTCDIPTKLEKRREEGKVRQFLMGLDDGIYGMVRSSLLTSDPLPSLNRVYSIIIQEERVRMITRAQEERGEIVGLAAHAKGRNREETKDKYQICRNCGRTGHDVNACFQLIGYPEWWGDRPKSDGKASGKSKMMQRGREIGVKANAAQTSTNGGATGPVTDADKAGLTGLTSDQWQKLMNMLNKVDPNEKMIGTFQYTSWIIDTGASNHMTGSMKEMHEVRDIVPCPVGLPNGAYTTATKEGTVYLGGRLKLTNVLFVPKLSCNLISVSQLSDESNCTIQFTNKLCVLQDRTSRMLIGAGKRKDGLYYLYGVQKIQIHMVDGMNQVDLWHKRLGHPSFKITQSIPTVSKIKVQGLVNKNCDVCFRAKQSREKFPASNHKAGEIFDLIHCDLWGPYRNPSSCGAYYFMIVVDDYSRGVWIYLLADKKEVSKSLMNFFALVNRQFNKKVKVFRSDNGTEFLCMKNYFSEQGIIFQTSCVHTPQQNGRVERKHRHILNIARALRFQGNLPIDFWGECILTAGYLINRTPSEVLNGRTPFEMLYGVPPSLQHLRVFGCLCYVHNKGRHSDKFAPKSKRCIFLGYPYGKKGWKVFDLETRESFVSRDVHFVEHEFPLSQPCAPQQNGVRCDSPYTTTLPNCEGEEMPHSTLNHNVDHDGTLKVRGGADCTNTTPVVNDVPTMPSSNNLECITTPPVDHEIQTVPLLSNSHDISAPADERLGRGYRLKKTSLRLRDYVTNTIHVLSPSTRLPSLSSSSGTPYPITQYVNCHNFSLAHRVFLAALAQETEPVTFKEAMKDLRWHKAMQDEIHALEDNQTWTLVPLLTGKKALGSKWVYKIKRKSDGTIERFKARLVILGNHQVEGIDYMETFAPVAKMVTVRIVLAVAAAKNWELHQMDVHNAFLHGDLQEEVFMKLPLGFTISQPGMVCKLRKSLYGLKQAPRCWFAKLCYALKAYGFVQSLCDYSLFVLNKRGIHLVVLVYVDDLIVAGDDHATIGRFKAYLHTCFHMKDLGPLKYFLGVEVARSSTDIYLCQRKYALDIIQETGLLGAKPTVTPLEQNHHLALADGPVFSHPDRYRCLVGRLIYLCFTRPELTYCVHMLSQFLQQPKQDHWNAALRVVRYLKGNPDQGILLRKDNNLILSGWCDSDWAACPLTRRSLTGWIIFLGNSPVSWKTKKQHTVSRSSTEAEYRSMATTMCELKWLKGILHCLGISHSQPMQLLCDSQAALHIAKNPLADILTKALGRAQFHFFLGKLGIHDLHTPT
ncbi:hypothetical protein V8G54_004004 [Vigna mungo]|uniref:Integrase catalytic domain-containing protein n=1 Tax=Vigna mungo TaxID=3915 RepID=A0AAQ3PFB8_VIGMU